MGFSIGSALGSVGKVMSGGGLGGLVGGPVGMLVGGAVKGLAGGALKAGKASKGKKAKGRKRKQPAAPPAQAKPSNPIQAAYHRDSFQAAPAKPTTAATATRPASPRPANSVQSWIAQAQAELRKLGIKDSQMNAKDLETLIQKESSGNPNAINDWDSNARRGTPSIGLMQTIQPTFDRYKAPGHDNIRNPVDNIIAGVRYSVDRYGSVSDVPGIRAMRSGGAYRGY